MIPGTPLCTAELVHSNIDNVNVQAQPHVSSRRLH
jgi:hypothetical protein